MAYESSRRDINFRFGALMSSAITKTFGSVTYYYESGADLKYQAWLVRHLNLPYYPQFAWMSQRGRYRLA